MCFNINQVYGMVLIYRLSFKPIHPSMQKNPIITTFYNPAMSLEPGETGSYSMSPAKAKLLMEHLASKDLLAKFEIVSEFDLLQRDDFYLAHTGGMITSRYCRCIL